MPEISVDHGPARRLSWTSVQLSDVTAAPSAPSETSVQSCGSSAVTPAAPPPPAAAVPASDPAAASLPACLSVAPAPELPSEAAPDPATAPAAAPPPPTAAPPPPTAAPPKPTAADALAARLRADSDGGGEVTVLGVALVANCHVSLLIFGLFFLAAGSLLCVIAFRAPTSVANDVQSRVAGTFFLCLSAVMCTFGLCLCRLDQQLSRRDQQKGAVDCGDCHMHSDASRCHRVLPSIQRARRSTQRVKTQMLRHLDERWMSAAGARHVEKTFSSIELLAAASTESIGCGRCNEASSYGTMGKSDVASFPS